MFSLCDRDVFDELPEYRLHNLLVKLIQNLKPTDLPESDYKEIRELNVEKLDLEQIKIYVKKLLNTAGVTELPHASTLGKGIARDLANWFYQTTFDYSIYSDPGTFLTAIHPELITSTQQVFISVDAKAIIEKNEKFMESDFKETIITKPGGSISAINGLLNNGDDIMKMVTSGLLAQIYPRVNYEEFMKITDDETMSLVTKSKTLNDLVKIRLEESIKERIELKEPQVSVSADSIPLTACDIKPLLSQSIFSEPKNTKSVAEENIVSHSI